MDSILEVTTAASTQDLTVVATVKAELGLTGADSDDEIQRLITEASSQMASYCDQPFARQTYRETFRLRRCVDRLMLSRLPVRDITAITADGTALEADEWEYEAKTGFVWRLDATDCRIAWRARKVEVDYVAGYTLLTELPYDVERLCIELVKRRWFAKRRDPALRSVNVPDVSSEQYWGGENAPMKGGLPADIADALEAGGYVRHSFG